MWESSDTALHNCSMTEGNPEIGLSIETGAGIVTNYHDVGAGDPVLLLHGSGPGVSAWANWRFAIGDLCEGHRMLAPDLAGFGFTVVPEDMAFTRDAWLRQVVDFMDAMGVERAHVIGNSFGGSMALALAINYPERVDRLVLMGSVGVPFAITPGLDAVWGYEPSVANMAAIMKVFAYDPGLVGPDLIEMRYQASLRIQEHFARMFPAPRQQWVDVMAHPESDVRAIAHPTLIIHGREDQVIPMSCSLTLLDQIPDSQLHVFGRCGHWTQIEHRQEFAALVREFLA